MLHRFLSKIAKEYVYERGKQFANSDFANFVRKDVAEEAKKQTVFLPYNLKVKASVGNSQWAAVPWLAFFDPLVTETATKGYYIVYLFNADTEEFYLSMNQGTTQVYTEYGSKRGREVLKRRATDISERIHEWSKNFDNSPIDLGSEADLPLGYQAGHAFGRKYHPDMINEKEFYKDLNAMFSAYQELLFRGGTTPFDAMSDEAGTTDVVEVRKYVLAKRIERTPGVRKKVLAKRDAICEACTLDPQKDYCYRGPIEKTPLDVHHCKPIHHLAEGEERRFKIPDDFLVLCPTCHRMIHKQEDPSNIEELKRNIKFKFAREIGDRKF